MGAAAPPRAGYATHRLGRAHRSCAANLTRETITVSDQEGARVAWVIRDGPEPGSWEGVDARSWRWEIERNAETRRLLVEVTGQAELTNSREEIRRAVETQGRSEVEGVLDRDDPPGRITLTSVGRREARYRG